MWEQQIMVINKVEYANRNTPTVALAHTKCPVDYEITDINAERSELFGTTPGFVLGTDYYITPDDGSGVDQTLKGIWDHDSGGEKNGYFWIRVVVYNNKGGLGGVEVLVDETKFWVNIIDPCIHGVGASNSIVRPTAIPDLIYVINGNPAPTTHNVAFWHDQASDLYGYGQVTRAAGNSQDNIYHICGKKTYGIYLADKETPINSVDHPYISWTDSVHSTTADPTDIVLSIYTQDPQWTTNGLVQYWIKATLDDYIVLYPEEATQWEPFNVNIQNCRVIDYTFSDPTASYQWNAVTPPFILYNIYTPVQWITMAEFVEVLDPNGPAAYSAGCNYVPTYTVKWRNFYDTTLELDYLNDQGTFMRWVNNLTPTDTTSEFRYEIYSNDPLDIDNTRQIYYLELTATIATADMDPPFSKTQQI